MQKNGAFLAKFGKESEDEILEGFSKVELLVDQKRQFYKYLNERL